MLRNDGRILKNGNNLFVAQVIESYIKVNTNQYNYVYLGVSGVSVNNPLHMYYETPLGTSKFNYTADSTYVQYLAATNETSYKEFYFSGNLNAVFLLNFYNPDYSYGYYYAGNLIKFVEQFPNLETLIININGNQYWNYSIFNQDLGNIKFSNKLKVLSLSDNTITGNVNLFTNFDKIEDLTLSGCQLTGNFSTVSFSSLKKVDFSKLYSLNGNFTDIINNFNLYWFSLTTCTLFSGDAGLANVSNLKYVMFDIQQSPGITGDISGWIFNTGLTNFQFRNGYTNSDITNWDFSNTKCSNIELNNYYYGSPYGKLYGSLSGWTLPQNISAMNFNGMSGLTSVPINYGTGFSSMYCLDCRDVEQDLNSLVFPNSTGFIYFHNYSKGKLYGNIENFVMPTGLTFLGIDQNNLIGNISGITFNSRINNLYLNDNLLHGEIIGKSFPDSLYAYQLAGNSGVTVNFNLGTFHTKNLQSIYWNSIKSITGSFSNLIFSSSTVSEFRIDGTPVHSDLSTLNLTKIYNLYAYGCGTGLTGNLTNWLTGSTNLQYVNIGNNPNISGNTSAWNVNGIYNLLINNTNLNGALKHNNVYYLSANYTQISSNIVTDFNFSNRGNTIVLDHTNITGNLSGVTLSFNQTYIFYVDHCPSLYGSNEFIEYLFINKNNFRNPYNSININMQNIGDTVTGVSETSGNTGTYYATHPGNNIMDLTEAYANNLAAGLDWNGSGSNTPWDSKNKIWWIRNAQVSSTNPVQRYVYFNINYA